MVFINEWLPNPDGVDTKGEFVELFNNGNVSVNLSGWSLKASAKKIFSLSGQTIAPKGYLVLTHAMTKLSLKNTGDTVSLYDEGGRLVDGSSYLGTAQSGQSFLRVYYPSAGSGVSDKAIAQPESFAWSKPTPGTANNVDLHNNISVVSHPFNVPLNRASLGSAPFFGILLGVSAILAALVVYFVKSDENISKLFFG